MNWRVIRNVGDWADYKVRARSADSGLTASAFPRVPGGGYPFLVPDTPSLDAQGVLVRVAVEDARTLLEAAPQE